MPSNEVYEKIAEWLEKYHSSVNAKKRAKYKTLIVSQMIPVVKNIAKTIARRATDPIEDMVQAGFIGLLKAIDNYSKNKNDNFRVYAGYFIIGEMKHYLRDKLNMIRVPRHIQELSIRINNFTRDLTLEEIQALTSDEVASALDISPSAVNCALQMDRRRSTLSLEDIYQSSNEEGLCYEELIAGQDYKERSEIEDAKIIFENVVDKLPPEERVVIDMYYKQDMSQKEIADALQLSQMHVSRKMKRAFSLMYRLVEEKQRDEDESQKKNEDD